MAARYPSSPKPAGQTIDDQTQPGQAEAVPEPNPTNPSSAQNRPPLVTSSDQTRPLEGQARAVQHACPSTSLDHTAQIQGQLEAVRLNSDTTRSSDSTAVATRPGKGNKRCKNVLFTSLL